MGLKSNIAAAIVGATLLGGIGIASAATGTSSSPTASPSSSSSSSRTCLGQHDDGWPLAVDGRPAGLDAGDHGIYLWHDRDGWHLRITHVNDNARLYTGSIVTDGTLTAQPVKLEKDDVWKIGPNDHALGFAFVNYGGIDGLDFQTSCAQFLRFDFKIDGASVPFAVHVGEDGHHPAELPLTVLRKS